MANWLQAANAIQQVLAKELDNPAYPSTKVFVGWPEPNMVLSDLRNPNTPNKAIVSIYPVGISKNDPRYGYDLTLQRFDATEVVDEANNIISLSGVLTTNDNVFVYINDKYVASTQVVIGDTFADVATRLAVGVNALGIGITAAALGAELFFTEDPRLITSLFGHAYGWAAATFEVARIQRRAQLTIWAVNELDRAVIVDAIFSSLGATQFLDYSDGSKGRVLFESDHYSDHEMAAGAMKAMMLFFIEYPVFAVQMYPIVGDVHITHYKVKPDKSLDVIHVEDNFRRIA